MFSQNRTRKKNISTDLLLFVTIAPLITPEALALSAIGLLGYRLYRYFNATSYAHLTPAPEPEYENIAEKDMLDPKQTHGMNPLEDLNDDEEYEVFTGFKPGFYDLFKKINKETPFTHCSIVIKMNQNNKHLIIGRQSPCDSMVEPASKKTIKEHGFKTVPCNEKNYGIFTYISYRIAKNDGVKFRGREIKATAKQAEINICEAQACNMVTSNCYSFSAFMLVELMATLEKRAQHGQVVNRRDFENLSRQFKALPKGQHGVGLMNNGVVLNALERAHAISVRELSR